MKTKANDKIVTIYTANVNDEQIRVAMDSKSEAYKVLRNALLNRQPAYIENPRYVQVMNEDRHMVNDPRKGTTIWLIPGGVTHFYITDYKEV